MQVHHIEGGTSRKCCPPRLTAATIFTGESDLQAVWSFEQGQAAEAFGRGASEAWRDWPSTGSQGTRRGGDCRPAGHHLGMVPKARRPQVRWLAETANPGPATVQQRS